MAGFIQIIEFRSSRWDELQALAQEFEDSRTAAGASGSSPTKIHVVADRDDPGRFLNIVEFESYEAAMENSQRPETGDFASKMAALCDGPPTFHNLDVRYEAQID
ncbi:putative quinol monooxygenase [Angustibacter sp. McL0619]|uniref:putative quinol monooxygenase n=1 Tax=Angustibacter sp. McL0619 TaxID=3415676 RepID=UPI003CF8C37B